MPKKKFFSSIFSRLSKSQDQEQAQKQDNQLVTDAVPAPDENSNDSTGNRIEEIHNSSPFPSGVLTPVNSNSRQLSPLSSSLPSRDLIANPYNAVPMANNHNMMAVHNIQAQNVYQFSNMSNLHIGSVINVKTGEAEPRTPSTPCTPSIPKEHRTKTYTRTTQAMQQSTEPLTQKYLSEISKHLGEGWQGVMRQLKFSEGQIHQATVDFHIDGGLQEVIYQLLLDWTRNEENATLGEITTILWSNGHYETVYYLKQVYKAEKNLSTQTKSEKMFCE